MADLTRENYVSAAQLTIEPAQAFVVVMQSLTLQQQLDNYGTHIGSAAR